MTSSANIEMNDVKAAFKRISPVGNRVFYESYHNYPTDSHGLIKSHFKGIASYNNKLIFTHTNLGLPVVGQNGPGKIIIADKQTSGDQASISAIYDTTQYHSGWSHPCSAQSCGSFMAMGIQITDDSSCNAEIHILDLTPLDINVQPKNIGTIVCVNKTGGQSLASAVNGVAMTKESGNDGKYIVAGLQGNALTLYRSVNSFLTANPADNIFNVVGDTIQNFPRSGAGIALITQTNGDIYIIALDTDNDEGDNNSIYLCQLTITDSTVSSSGVLDSKNMPVPGLSEAVRYATNGWVITDIGTLGGDSDLAAFLTTFATGIQNINILNTSFRWGKGLEITSPDDIKVYATDRNDLTTSRFSRPVDTKKDFSLVVWTGSPSPQPPSNNFAGAYAPSNWKEATSAPVGSLWNLSQVPSAITLQSDPSWQVSTDWMTIIAPASGSIAFSWVRSTNDGNVHPCWYVVNDIRTLLNPSATSGNESVLVNAGDSFSIMCQSNDGSLSSLVISNFSGPLLGSSVLPLNTALPVGGTLVSINQQFFAVMQSDGNLCVYRGTPQNQGAYMWGSQAIGGGGQFFTIVQGDGNLCTYYGTQSQQGAYLWGSQALSDGGQFFLVMQDDGNLCVYKGTGLSDQGAFVWGWMNI